MSIKKRVLAMENRAAVEKETPVTEIQIEIVGAGFENLGTVHHPVTPPKKKDRRN